MKKSELQVWTDSAVNKRVIECHDVPSWTHDVPTVLTYYEPRQEETDYSADILRLWSNMWQHHGWNVVVLNESMARTHFMYQDFKEAVARLPTINSKSYEMNCYMRWLAYEKWTECTRVPVLVVDYDVLNQGLNPTEWTRLLMGRSTTWDSRLHAEPLCALHYPDVPALVTVNHLGLVRLRTLFMWQATHCQVYPVSWREFWPRIHTSDMMILRDQAESCPFMKLDSYLVSEFGDPYWDTSLVCHFSHHHTHSQGYALQWQAMTQHVSSQFTFLL